MVKQKFKFVDNHTPGEKSGYAIVDGTKRGKTLDWVEFLTEDTLNEISGKAPPKGYQYVYVIEVTKRADNAETTSVRWNIGMTVKNVFNRYEPKTGWGYHVIRVFLSKLTDKEIHEKIVSADAQAQEEKEGQEN